MPAGELSSSAAIARSAAAVLRSSSSAWLWLRASTDVPLAARAQLHRVLDGRAAAPAGRSPSHIEPCWVMATVVELAAPVTW